MAGTLPAWYAGSPLQLDFGETGQEKTFLFIEAAPRRPARVKPVLYEGGRPLRAVAGTPEELQDYADGDRQDCWLQVTVKLTAKDPDINRRIRQMLPTALVVRVDLPQAETANGDRPAAGASATELYAAYHRREHEREPAPNVLAEFGRLHEQAAGNA